jgi:superkiller protein 3
LLGQTPALPELPQLNVANFFPAVRDQVERAYDEAQANPESARASGELGMVLDAYEQYETATVCYQRARLLDAAEFRWAYYLGWIRAALGEYSEAESTLREALQINPEYLPAKLKLAETLLAAGKWEESGKVYRDVVQQYPDLPVAHYGLGRIYSARGDLSAAVESLRKACDLFPPYGAARYALALAYRKLGASEKASENFKLYEQNKTAAPGVEDPMRRAVAQLNRDPLSRARRAIELEKAGKIEEAVAQLEKALEIVPNQVQVHINLISLYGRLGQFEKAVQHFEAAVNLNPHRAESYYGYGVLLSRRQQFQEAQRAFEQAVQINPFYAEAYHNLGVLFEQQGRLEEAMRQYEQAVSNQPNYRLAHFHMGRILVNQEKYDEAIRHLVKTLAPEDEATPAYRYALGAAYARAGRVEEALRSLRHAREEALAHGQAQLLSSIERDLKILETERIGRQ